VSIMAAKSRRMGQPTHFPPISSSRQKGLPTKQLLVAPKTSVVHRPKGFGRNNAELCFACQLQDFAFLAFALLPACVLAQTSLTPVAPVPNPCPRFEAGHSVQTSPALFSSGGVLAVSFSFKPGPTPISASYFAS
jgi:hypothetical protein